MGENFKGEVPQEVQKEENKVEDEHVKKSIELIETLAKKFGQIKEGGNGSSSMSIEIDGIKANIISFLDREDVRKGGGDIQITIEDGSNLTGKHIDKSHVDEISIDGYYKDGQHGWVKSIERDDLDK